MQTSLSIKNLYASIDEQAILHGVSLTIKPGEVHAVMGPNGSGKSTMASVLAGHPAYTVTDPEQHKTELTLDGEDILEAAPDERAQLGLFLAFQYPVEVPGVSVQKFLREAHTARFKDTDKEFKKVIAFRKHLQQLADTLNISQDFLERGLNEGFSGGEKKQLEILQMAVLEPKYAILDETDSGLDIDAIQKVATGVKKIQELYGTGIIVITHYQRILEYLTPDFVHVLVKGKIVKEGGAELVLELEKTGYKELLAGA